MTRPDPRLSALTRQQRLDAAATELITALRRLDLATKLLDAPLPRGERWTRDQKHRANGLRQGAHDAQTLLNAALRWQPPTPPGDSR